MFKQWINDTLDDQIRDLQTLVRIPSVSRGEPKAGMPLGENVHRALTEALALANRSAFPIRARWTGCAASWITARARSCSA